MLMMLVLCEQYEDKPDEAGVAPIHLSTKESCIAVGQTGLDAAKKLRNTEESNAVVVFTFFIIFFPLACCFTSQFIFPLCSVQ